MRIATAVENRNRPEVTSADWPHDEVVSPQVFARKYVRAQINDAVSDLSETAPNGTIRKKPEKDCYQAGQTDKAVQSPSVKLAAVSVPAALSSTSSETSKLRTSSSKPIVAAFMVDFLSSLKRTESQEEISDNFLPLAPEGFARSGIKSISGSTLTYGEYV
jgi:hypothetical protein